MNFKTTALFFSAALIYGCESSLSQNTNINSKDTCFYALHLPADIDMPETPHFDTTITRNSSCTVHILRLPSWGTSTSYSLTSPDNKKENNRSVHFYHSGKGVIDITDLPTGKYGMYLLACGNGGGFTLRIK